MNNELEHVATILQGASSPEEVFGKLGGSLEEQLKEGNRIFRKMARVTHPDAFLDGTDRKLADEAFKKLNQLWEQAQQKLANGAYGIYKPETELIMVKTRKHEFVVGETVSSGDICNIYGCSFIIDGKEAQGVFKVPRDCSDNDLVGNEAKVLKHLASSTWYSKYQPYVPQLVETFAYKDNTSPVTRQVNVLALPKEVANPKELYSLKEVMEYYPTGINPKDMAWILRRLLVALGFAHSMGIVHGAVIPTHVLIHPEKHGLLLVDWCYAVSDPANSGERICAISSEYESSYPPEVLNKESPALGTDIYMAVNCMVNLLGGETAINWMPSSVPARLQAFLKGCLLTGIRQRPNDAWSLLKEFDELLEGLWGKRTFHPFHLPAKR